MVTKIRMSFQLILPLIMRSFIVRIIFKFKILRSWCSLLNLVEVKLNVHCRLVID